MPLTLLEATWAAPPNVRAGCTVRFGGSSAGPYATLNLGVGVGDAPALVAENRRRLLAATGCGRIQWLHQTHGTEVFHAPAFPHGDAGDEAQGAPADAVWTDAPGLALAVLVADCVPALLCDGEGSVVAAMHCGWRGATGGVIEATLATLPAPPHTLCAWLGPAICGQCYEVGADVHEHAGGGAAFTRVGRDKWRFDLPAYVAGRLTALGVREVARSGLCSACDGQFFSHRRDGVTGRMAAVIWMR